MPEGERERFVDWAMRLLRRGTRTAVFDGDDFMRRIGEIRDYWDVYDGEGELKPYTTPEEDTIFVDPGPDENKKRQEHYSRTLPPQCRRRIYTDSNGVLRSIVICESLGSQRVHHDV
jgi:hypothetical protein